ncbi:MAG: single-stranded DNA-binding protein [Bacilli bacterium]|nr:single-stranded DNA-binding protein [Bacilli bacterium]MBQ8901826.1 single-stranded DNA-binding protein [Bacilli bacterium]
MNKVLLVGRLTRDPELRTTPSGMAVTRFTIAVSQNFTNKNGERGADFINCSAWGRQADNISKYCRKGTLVSAEGRIRTSSYDAQDGTKRYTTEVVCDTVNFLSSRTGGESTSSRNDFVPDANELANMPMETADLTEDPFKSFGEEITLSSDDLPF